MRGALMTGDTVNNQQTAWLCRWFDLVGRMKRAKVLKPDATRRAWEELRRPSLARWKIII